VFHFSARFLRSGTPTEELSLAGVWSGLAGSGVDQLLILNLEEGVKRET